MSDVLNRYKVHPNGSSNLGITIGHRLKQATCGFAEKDRYKTDKKHRNKTDTEWGTGYDLGSNSRTAEHLIGTEQGIVEVDIFKRMPDDVAHGVAYDEDRVILNKVFQLALGVWFPLFAF